MPSYEHILSSLPEGGIFGGDKTSFLFSPNGFPLDAKEVKTLEKIGHVLQRFQLACDRIYKRSHNGKAPAWIHEVLDAGKPAWMIEQQRVGAQKGQQPRVIRPDLLLTEKGYSLTEIDAVPGGIGLTAWLQQHYENVIGGDDGMLAGFHSLSESGLEILLSQESGDYRAELDWLLAQLRTRYDGDWKLSSAEDYSLNEDEQKQLYRFFELFDWEQISESQKLSSYPHLTSPIKPHFEEKLWLALFWTPALAEVWKEELRESQIQLLQEIIPYSWVVDPTPLPLHASLPRLGLHSWSQVGALSQKQRELVLKVSGFSELAWGSRGVTVGHDVSNQEWKQAIQKAEQEFKKSPYILQEFAHTKLIEHDYYDHETQLKRTMKGRVRLCPYYFIKNKETRLSGCLATINPADKKKIHGMKDAVLTVGVFNEEER